jgi:hypothetical protein
VSGPKRRALRAECETNSGNEHALSKGRDTDGEPKKPACRDLWAPTLDETVKPRNRQSKAVKIVYVTGFPKQFWLILPEGTAIGIRLSHASREV